MSFRRFPGMGRKFSLRQGVGGQSVFRLEPGMLVLVAIQVVLYLFTLVPPLGQLIALHLVLAPQSVFLQGKIWQPLTALFVHLSLGTLLLDAVLTWLMGSFIERALGTRRAVRLFIVTGIAGNLAAAAVGAAMRTPQVFFGVGPCLFALMAATGLIYGRTQVLFFGAMPARADIISWIFVGFWLVRRLIFSEVILLASDLAAGVACVLLLRRGGPRPDGLRTRLARLRLWWLRRRYKVIDGGKKNEDKPWMN